MSTQAVTKEDIASSVVPTIKITAPWRVKAVKVLDGYRLQVCFLDGVEGEVDMSEFVCGLDAGVFAALADPDIFAQAYVQFGAVAWPGELDLAPDAMHDEIEKNGIWILK